MAPSSVRSGHLDRGVVSTLFLHIPLKCFRFILRKKEMGLLIIPLPELDGSDVGGDEDGAAQEGVEGGGEDGRHNGLHKQHGRVWAQLVKDGTSNSQETYTGHTHTHLLLYDSTQKSQPLIYLFFPFFSLMVVCTNGCAPYKINRTFTYFMCICINASFTNRKS